MSYEVATETYQGPLDKLLELIEERKMEITQLNLAEVTADFLEYVAKLEKVTESEPSSAELRTGVGAPPGLLADFLVIASKLILIKSKALLPSLPLTAEEEEEVVDLEHRLRLYREFKEAQKHLARGWSSSPRMYAREFLMANEAAFYPPRKLSVPDLAAAFGRVLGELERIAKPTGHMRAGLITIGKKIEEVLRRLTSVPMHFGELGRGGNRSDIVVLFLAILHLLKTQTVRVEQEEHFGEIIVARRSENA